MMNFLKSLTGAKTAAPKADKPTQGSCGSDKSGMEAKKEDMKKDGGGCCGGHCH